MKYTFSIKIDAPLTVVLNKWKNIDNFKYWQDDFKSYDLVKGNLLEVGAEAIIVFQGINKIVLKETILENNLPHSFMAEYNHTHMRNTQETKFKSLSENETLFTTTIHYVEFKKVLVKIITKLFPKKFKNQSLKWMKQFKGFVEKSN